MNKRSFFSILLAIAMVFSIVVMPAEVVKAEGKEVLTIIHTNDVHGNASEDEKGGKLGYAKLKTFVDSKEGNVLLLDAGDVLHGTTLATINKGQSMIDLMNALGYDAMSPGNHDYNYGKEQLYKLSESAKFPIIHANVVDKKGNLPLPANTIVEFGDIKVGIFGITTPETMTKSNPKNTEGLEFKDYIKTSVAQVAELKAKGANVIVGLVHLGLDAASEERSDLLAKEVEGIDVLIDGHSHTLLDEPKLENGVLIAQTGCHLNGVGEVTIVLEDGKVTAKTSKVHSYEDLKDLEANKEILDKIAEIEEGNKPFLDQVLGKAAVDLDGVRENVRTRETNLGNLLTDAMLELTKADVALTNGGGIRAPIAAGEIKMGDVLQSFPFANYPVLLEVKGEVVKKALEHGLDKAPEVVGKFPHVAGITFKYDPKQEPGSRVFDIKVGDEALDLAKSYKLVTNDFMSVGGDGYEMLKEGKKLAEFPLLSEVLANYIKAKGTVEPKVEGRITVADKPVEKTDGKTDFKDIKGHWAEKYINDVTESKIFKGITATSFEPDTNITRAMIVTTLYRLEGEPEAKASPFADVKDDAWYGKAVAWAAENKIVEGYGDGNFRPDNELLREEMAAIINRYLNFKGYAHTDAAIEFADQDKISDWAVKDINNLVAAKIMQGKPGNLFDPQGNANRGELAKVMAEVKAIVEKIETKVEAKPAA